MSAPKIAQTIYSLGKIMIRPRRRQLEKAEQAAIVKLLRLLGAEVYVIGTHRRAGDYQGTNQTPGMVDLWAFCKRLDLIGRRSLVAIEVKAPAGRLSEAQEWFRAMCRVSDMLYVTGGYQQVVDYLVAQQLMPADLAGKRAFMKLPTDKS